MENSDDFRGGYGGERGNVAQKTENYTLHCLQYRTAARTQVHAPGLKLQTIHTAKGLQYCVVILLWADQLPGTFEDSNEAADRRLLYVALTRPEDLLIITASGTGSV